MEDKQTNLPVMSNDPSERILRQLQRYDPSFKYFRLLQLSDYPAVDDYELMLHFLRGGAGPFIELFLYIDLGVDWSFKAEGFSNEERGLQAIELVEEEYFHKKRMDFRTTMNMFGAFWEILGRTDMVDTYTLSGDFFYDKYMKVTGRDCINPMTFDSQSVRDVMLDTTGKVPFKQNGLITGGKSIVVPLEQDRVQFFTNNILTKSGPLGNSPLLRCVTDFRTLARFPHYRNKLGKKYSELFRIIEIDSTKIGEHGIGKKITDNVEEAQKYLDDTAEFYRDQEEKGGTAAVFDWEKVIESSFAGKEIKMDDIERSTLASLGFKLGVPIELLMFGADLMNRDTLRGLLDVCIARREKGARKHLYTPMIEDTANKILEINGMDEGRLKVKYNPFLSKDYVQLAEIISKLWPTNSVSRPEIREIMDYSKEINMGGDEWKDLDPMPSGNNNPVIPEASTGGFTPSEKVLVKELLQKGLIRHL